MPERPHDVDEWRKTPRFILDPPIIGSFGSHELFIYNIGENGVQAEHTDKLHRGTELPLRFALPVSPRVITLKGKVAWCRQARKTNPLEKWPYRSGITVDGIHALTLETLGRMLELELVRPEKNSLERKRRLMEERASRGLDPKDEERGQEDRPETLSQSFETVQQARKRLREDPRLVERWAGEAADKGAESGESNRDILAVWALLHGRVDLRIVALVFDLYPEP